MEKRRRNGNQAVTRRDFLKTAGLTGAALAGAAAFPRAVGAQRKEVFILTEEADPKSIAFFKKAFGQYKAKHAGVEIREEHTFYVKQVQRAAQLVSAGEPPDIIDTGTLDAALWAKKGLLEPVTDLVNEIGGFDPASRLVIDGQDYMVPANRNFVYYFYRQDLLEKAKLNPPRTWAEYLDVAAKLTQGPIKGSIVLTNAKGVSDAGEHFSWAWCNGARFSQVTPDGKFEVILDQEPNLTAMAETLGFIKQLHQYSPATATWTWVDVLNAYVGGNIATTPYWGARMIEHARAKAPQIEPVTKAMPVPYAKLPKGFQWQEGWSVFKTKNTQLAKDIVRFLSTGRTHIEFLWSVPMHLIPAKREVLRSEEYQSEPFIKSRLDVVKAIDEMWDRHRDTMYDIEGTAYRVERAAFWNTVTFPQMVGRHVLANEDPKKLVQWAAGVIRKYIKDTYA